MKTLLKFILGILIFLIVVIGIPLGILYYNIVDKNDEAPIELYTDDVTFSSELTKLFDASLDLENKDSIDFAFTEEDLNKLIFAIVKDSINEQYQPNKTSPTDDEAYIESTTLNLPILGKKKVLIKHIYAEINGKNLELYVTMDLLGVKSVAKLIASFEEEDDYFKITFLTVGLGKMNLLSGLGNKIFKEALKLGNTTEDSINNNFEQKNLPLEVNLEDNELKISKDKINQLILKFVKLEDMADSKQSSMFNAFINILASRENDIINFGLVNNKLGLSFDLEKFRVDPSFAVLSEDIKTFNKTSFMQNKVQGYIISNLTNPQAAKITFTNKELNQIIYDQSNGYEEFNISIPLPNSASAFDITIKGILLSFTNTGLTIRVIMNLNGLDTSLFINGTVENNNTDTVTIKINDEITLGQDIDEVTGEYITGNSDLILSLLGDNIDDMGIMSFDYESKSLVLSAESFTQLMAVDGTNVTPLIIDRLNVINGGIEAYSEVDVTNPLYLPITVSTNAIQTALEANNFTTSDFDTTDPEEAENVNTLLTSLNDVSDGITNGTLTDVQTSNLINNYNSLSADNQDAFITKLESESASPDLITLYESLFGK